MDFNSIQAWLQVNVFIRARPDDLEFHHGKRKRACFLTHPIFTANKLDLVPGSSSLYIFVNPINIGRVENRQRQT